MNNEFDIKNDGTTIYLTLAVKSHSIGKFLLSLMVCVLFGLLFYVPSLIPKEEISTYIFQ
jgi:hypothetical protein